MDPITQIAQKMIAERARQVPQQQRTPPLDGAPPPYTPSDSDDDSDDADDDAPEPSSPLKLTINAVHSIQGSNNLVPTSTTPSADATKFSTLLLHAVNQINSAADSSAVKPRRSIKVDLTINYGITIVGDRNVIGNVGLKPKSPADAVAGPGAVAEKSVVAGAKRKVGEESEDGPEPKQIKIETSPA